MSDHIDRAAEIIHAQVHYDTPPEVTSCGVCHDAVDSLMGHGGLVTPAHDAAVAAKAVQGVADRLAVQDVEPWVVRTIYSIADRLEQEGDDGPDLLAALVRSVEKARESRRHEGEADDRR